MRAVPVFAHGVKVYGTHEILKYWEIGKNKNNVVYWNWYTGTMDWTTDVESAITTEIFPLCRPRIDYGEVPKQFQLCINETGQSDPKCIDSVVMSDGGA